ncbi:MAG: glycoside hydrolase family 3 C-terminal domain-containing protein [Lachnospiraceae bacterium]|nr:glycoside hydrolase family 3 C-terminal domain-containing protein [Lachnospiraceae bacterium]
MVKHGICADLKEAALTAFQAGVDIDMCSMAYNRYLPELVEEGKISEEDLDRSVMRVLRLKSRLGLFEDPYRGAFGKTDSHVILCTEHRSAARKAVCESLVLLKNEGEKSLLPLKKDRQTALIGPYLKCEELFSAWSPTAKTGDTVTLLKAAGELEEYSFTYSQGCRLDTREDVLAKSRESSVEDLRKGVFAWKLPSKEEDDMLAAAVRNAKDADTVVMLLGEHRSLSGEGASRGDITLPENQVELLKAIYEVNRNIVTVVFGGRPLDLREVCLCSRSVVMAWLPGTEGGHGVMDVLTGCVNFSGKLSMSIPVSVGQIPVYYNQLRTGRPKDPVLDEPNYVSAYLDSPNRPLFPFGYGLSYSRFSISDAGVSRAQIEGAFDPDDEESVLLTAGAEIENLSERAGTAVIQMYLRDDVSSLARPGRELKAFKRISLASREKKTVSFAVTPAMLAYTGPDGKRILEKGSFTIWIGEDSETRNQAGFSLK